MTRRAIAFGLWGLLALILLRKNASMVDSAIQSVADSAPNPVNRVVNYVEGVIMGTWWEVANRPENSIYFDALHVAEDVNGIPANMLVALAYQESHFRPDIISGQTVSGAGALGIMQIVPKWHPGVDPLDPIAAINYAGKFLKSLFNRFGRWELALQAYNWGGGNLNKYLSGDGIIMPAETQNYSANILARVAETGVAVA